MEKSLEKFFKLVSSVKELFTLTDVAPSDLEIGVRLGPGSAAAQASKHMQPILSRAAQEYLDTNSERLLSGARLDLSKEIAALLPIANDEIASLIAQGATYSGNLQERAMRVCKHRSWPTHWTARSAYLHLEASELTEAIRGKGGDKVKEAGDVLIALLVMTGAEGIAWSDVVESAGKTMTHLMNAPPYEGELREDGGKVSAHTFAREDIEIDWIKCGEMHVEAMKILDVVDTTTNQTTEWQDYLARHKQARARGPGDLKVQLAHDWELLKSISAIPHRSMSQRIDRFLKWYSSTLAEPVRSAHAAGVVEKLLNEALDILTLVARSGSVDWTRKYEAFKGRQWKLHDLVDAVEEAWRLIVSIDWPESPTVRQRIERWRLAFFAEFGAEKHAEAKQKAGSFQLDPLLRPDVMADVMDRLDDEIVD